MACRRPLRVVEVADDHLGAAERQLPGLRRVANQRPEVEPGAIEFIEQNTGHVTGRSGEQDGLAPEHFAVLWGQSYVNLHAALAECTDEEKALARKHIAVGGASLHLPLSSHVEFDS